MAEGRERPSFQLPPSAYYLKDWKEVERPDRATVLLAQATICSSDTSNLEGGREGGVRAQVSIEQRVRDVVWQAERYASSKEEGAGEEQQWLGIKGRGGAVRCCSLLSGGELLQQVEHVSPHELPDDGQDQLLLLHTHKPTGTDRQRGEVGGQR